MKIIEIIPQLASGGAERLVVDLSNELAKSHEVILLTYYKEDNLNFYAHELSSAVTHITLGKELGLSFKAFISVSSVIRKMKPDVVHLHLSAIYYALPSIFFNHNVLYLLTIHNDADKEAEGFRGGFIRKLCFKSGLVIPVTISKESNKSFRKFYGIEAPIVFNGRVIPEKIDITEAVLNEFKIFRRTSKTRVLINLARFSEIKRQPLIAKCVKRLYEEGYDFSFLMIGKTSRTDILNQVKLCECEILHILGEKKNPLEYLKMSDSYCLFSSFEGMPISLIEALGTGAIPVCTPVGGIVDVVKDGENGLLAEDLTEEAVYNVLKRFLNMSDEDFLKMKRKTLESYYPYSIKECTKQYLQLFSQVNHKE
ncbi:glycosyltransferase [Parabacteroides chongii]|uniref:glycosyltransferase n=1 Tax=Parabacteroides chongii TaxID=2685834 RepID=UPI00240E4866|nr:glycosyltransferase [Parabacteroides chongii]WFE83579.1 glycosyltransferase [Parabacteroides chongii]